jgi:A/G-specific adenine glycosylase
MAQQTQVSRVDEAWVGFMERFPTPAALADAPTAHVLRAWRGLGYNRRAVALQRAAHLIVERHGGHVPDSVTELEALPGVGPYTSRAVAALAHGQPVAAVDTNVRRVIGRLLGAEPARSELQAIADTLVAPADPAGWTHAMMELGATVCRARSPQCGACPVSRWCRSAGAVTHADDPDRKRHTPFEHTTRWLRGRIVATLRDQEDGTWTALPSSFGSHGPDRVEASVAALKRDGLVERRDDGHVRLPSSLP